MPDVEHGSAESPRNPTPTPPLEGWRWKLLPFMRWMLGIVTGFFLLATFYQLYVIQTAVNATPEKDLAAILAELDEQNPTLVENSPDAYRWRTACALEGYALDRRYRQAASLLMNRIWLNYIGFLTGMMLAITGATFILGRLRESDSHLGGGFSEVNVSLRSSSPGLFLAVLGTILMLTTISIHRPITNTDAPSYLLTAVAPGVQIDSTPTLSQDQKNSILEKLRGISGPKTQQP